MTLVVCWLRGVDVAGVEGDGTSVRHVQGWECGGCFYFQNSVTLLLCELANAFVF